MSITGQSQNATVRPSTTVCRSSAQRAPWAGSTRTAANCPRPASRSGTSSRAPSDRRSGATGLVRVSSANMTAGGRTLGRPAPLDGPVAIAGRRTAFAAVLRLLHGDRSTLLRPALVPQIPAAAPRRPAPRSPRRPPSTSARSTLGAASTPCSRPPPCGRARGGPGPSPASAREPCR
jgi:hypothetical protein